MSRRSTLAVSTLVSELNVRSTTLPDRTCLSLVRTTVLPLPGLWCWNQTTDHSWPFKSRTMPFFRSFVDATRTYPSVLVARQGQPLSLDQGVRGSDDAEAHRQGLAPGERQQQRRPVVASDGRRAGQAGHRRQQRGA